DLTTLDGLGFALDAGAKELYRLEPSDRTQTILPLPDEVVITDSGNLDMVGGLGSIWIVQGGVLYRIDPASGDLTATVELGGGDYAALATGEGYVWVLEGGAGDTSGGRLFKVDPDTAEVVGEPLEFEGQLVDVAAGGGSVWVTSRNPDVLLQIAPSGAE
nr:hypothetical protein [Actinomycetota bacterium]